jgi:hypothetical protein
MRILTDCPRICTFAPILLSRPVHAQPTQPIYLQYDGFVHNTDGSYTLSFATST